MLALLDPVGDRDLVLDRIEAAIASGAVDRKVALPILSRLASLLLGSSDDDDEGQLDRVAGLIGALSAFGTTKGAGARRTALLIRS